MFLVLTHYCIIEENCIYPTYPKIIFVFPFVLARFTNQTYTHTTLSLRSLYYYSIYYLLYHYVLSAIYVFCSTIKIIYIYLDIFSYLDPHSTHKNTSTSPGIQSLNLSFNYLIYSNQIINPAYKNSNLYCQTVATLIRLHTYYEQRACACACSADCPATDDNSKLLTEYLPTMTRTVPLFLALNVYTFNNAYSCSFAIYYHTSLTPNQRYIFQPNKCLSFYCCQCQFLPNTLIIHRSPCVISQKVVCK